MEKSKSKIFENHIRSIFKDYTPDNKSSDWEGFEKNYDAALKKARYLKTAKFLSVAAVIVSVITLYWLFNYTSEHKLIEKEIIIEKPVDTVDNELHIDKSESASVSPEQSKPLKDISKDIAETHPKNQKEIAEEPIQERKEIVDKSQKTEDYPKAHVKDIDYIKDISEEAWEQLQKFIYNLTIESSKITVCAGEEVRFSPSIINHNYSYEWSFGDGHFSNTIFPTHVYEEPGVYEVSLLLKGDEEMQLDAVYNMQIQSLPVAKFDFDINQRTFGYPQVSFLDRSLDATQWKWSFGDGRFSYKPNPAHVYFVHENTTYQVELMVENAFGCKNSKMVEIEFADVFDLMAPNAFSPDGDGINDYFIPKALEVLGLPFEMFIYDRGGNMVYKTKCYTRPWDGRIGTTGVIPDNGTFIWIVMLSDNDGETYKYAGTVSIIK